MRRAARAILVAVVALVLGAPVPASAGLTFLGIEEVDSGFTEDGRGWVRTLFATPFPPEGLFSWFFSVGFSTVEGQFQYVSQEHRGERTMALLSQTGEEIPGTDEVVLPDESVAVILPVDVEPGNPLIVGSGERPSRGDQRVDDQEGTPQRPIEFEDRVGDPREIFAAEEPPATEEGSPEPGPEGSPSPAGAPVARPSPRPTAGGAPILPFAGAALLAFVLALLLATIQPGKESFMGTNGLPNPRYFDPTRQPFPEDPDFPPVHEWKLDVHSVLLFRTLVAMEQVKWGLSFGHAGIIGLLAVIAGLTPLQGFFVGLGALPALLIVQLLVPLFMHWNRARHMR